MGRYVLNAHGMQIQPYFYKNNQISWIKPGKDYCIKLEDDIYENIQKTEDMPIQCSFPLSRSLPQYNCIQMEVSNEGNGASVGIASCSPVKPTPTLSLLRDY